MKYNLKIVAQLFFYPYNLIFAIRNISVDTQITSAI